jgi:AcrR family transcriptional regulator
MADVTAASLFAEHSQAAHARRRSTKQELYESQRGRLLQAVVASAAEKGYGAMTIADIVSGAAISRNAFYDHFSDKEDCFLAALSSWGELLSSEVLAIPVDPHDDRATTRARVRALLGAMEALPQFSQVLLFEAPAAGRRAYEVLAQLRDRFALVLYEEQLLAAKENPDIAEIPQAIFDAVVGGVLELLRIALLKDPPAPLAAFEDDIVLFIRLIAEAPPAFVREATSSTRE